MAFKLSGKTTVKQHFFIRLVSGENCVDIYDSATIDVLCFKANVIRQIAEAKLTLSLTKKTSRSKRTSFRIVQNYCILG